MINKSGNVKKNECKNLFEIKKEIRNEFNPKFDDPELEIIPLNKGVSHDHVIHSSENEFDFIKLDEALNKFATLKKIIRYK